jgi:multidrug resistance efflux pump
METDLNAFDDYKDKMNKLANALEAEAYHLNNIQPSSDEALAQIQEARAQLKEASLNIIGAKISVLPGLSVN